MEHMSALLIDLDGVLYEGDRVVPGAAEAVTWMRMRKIPHLFLTNTTSRPRAALVEKLTRLGIATDAEAIHTPPVAAVRWLGDHAPGPVALFVPRATASEFQSHPLLPDGAEEGAASVVLGDLGNEWDFARLNRAFRLLMAEPRPVLIALGMTRYFQAPDGLRLDVAPFVKALEHATGATAVVLGKPAGPFFEAALRLLGCPTDDAMMVGDDIVGDVQGAQRAGLRAILVRTGKFRPSDLTGDIRPDAVLGSIADLAGWWERQ
jgi:phospholysine phosphohistidine inorganic pyrophosphate phosphatase